MSRVTTLHADHGIAEKQKEYIANYLRMFAPPHFFIIEIDIPSEFGTVPNGMYGPACGDAPVDESDVSYVARGDREWKDRMVDLPTRACSYVQAIGTRGDNINSSGNPDGDITVFTVYGGPVAPQHPDDPTNGDPAASKLFWAEHALSSR